MSRYGTAFSVSGASGYAGPSGAGLSTAGAPGLHSVSGMFGKFPTPNPANIGKVPLAALRVGRVVLPRISPWTWVAFAGLTYLYSKVNYSTNLSGYEQTCFRPVDASMPGLRKASYLCLGLGSIGDPLAPGEVYAGDVGKPGLINWFGDQLPAQHIGYRLLPGVEPYAPFQAYELPHWPFPHVHPAQNGRVPVGDPDLQPLPPWRYGRAEAPARDPFNPNNPDTSPYARPRVDPAVRPLPEGPPIGDPMAPPDPRPSPAPIQRPVPGPTIELYPRPSARPADDARPKPPRAQDKERKYRNRVVAAVNVGAHLVTESYDVLRCFHKALPKSQRTPVKKIRYKKSDGTWVTKTPTSAKGVPISSPPPQVMARDLWNNWTAGDFEQRRAKLSNALSCVFAESLQDFVLGQTSSRANQAFRNLPGKSHRDRPFGLGSGPAL